jgi:hypothetical protein
VTLIHERARGIPRTVSVLCDNALVTGLAMNRRPVDQEIVTEVARDFDFESPSMAKGGWLVPSITDRSLVQPGTTVDETAIGSTEDGEQESQSTTANANGVRYRFSLFRGRQVLGGFHK